MSSNATCDRVSTQADMALLSSLKSWTTMKTVRGYGIFLNDVLKQKICWIHGGIWKSQTKRKTKTKPVIGERMFVKWTPPYKDTNKKRQWTQSDKDTDKLRTCVERQSLKCTQLDTLFDGGSLLKFDTCYKLAVQPTEGILHAPL